MLNLVAVLPQVEEMAKNMETKQRGFKYKPCNDCEEPVAVQPDWPDVQPVWCDECYNEQLVGEYAD